MAQQGFALTVRLRDEATGPLAKINRAIFGLESAAGKANAGSKKIAKDGLPLIKDALGGIKKQAADLADGLSKVVRPLEGLTGPLVAGAGLTGIAAGLAEMTQRFGNVGSELARTSANLGISTVDLQKWRGSADLAGVGAEAMNSSLQGLSHGIYMARAGLNPDMFRAAQEFGIDLNKGATDAEKAQNVLLELADKFRSDPRLRNNAQARKQLLDVLGVSPEMQSYLLMGRAKLEQLNNETLRHSYLTNTQIANAVELQHSYIGLTQSVSGFSNAIGAQLAPTLAPLLTKMTNWLDQLKQQPAAMKAVATGAEVLAGVLGVSMVSGIAKLTFAMNSLWLSPLMRFLVSPAGAAGIASLEFLTSNGIGGLIPSKKAPGSDFNPGAPPTLEHDWLQRQVDWIYNLFGGHAGHTSYTTSTTPMDDAAKKRIADATAAYQKLGWSRADAVAIASNQFRESGLINKSGDWGTAQGIGQWHPDRQANFRKLFGHDLKDATLDEQYRFTDWELKHTEANAAQRLKAAKTAAEKAAVLSRYYERPKAQDEEAEKRASLAEQITKMLAPIGPADAAGRMVRPSPVGGNASRPIGGSVSAAPTVKFPEYPLAPPVPASGLSAQSPAVMLPPKVPTEAPGKQGALDLNRDSKHEVFLNINGALPGMRAGISHAEGPATTAVRVQYSLDNLS